jgi:hypothetical protein
MKFPPDPQPLLQLQGWKHPLPLLIGHALAPLPTPFSHWQPLSVTHQFLPTPGPIQPNPSPLPMPPAADTYLPSLPTRLPWPAPSTGQHQSLMKIQATYSNGANLGLTPPSPLSGTPPTQKNVDAYAKALAPVPMMVSASKAPTTSSPSWTTRSQPSATGKSPTPRSFARPNLKRERC